MTLEISIENIIEVMNKLYGDKRQFAIHSRHMSQRQHPTSLNNLFKRQQSANRLSRTKFNDEYFCNMYSTGLFPKRDSVGLVVRSNNWIKPKTKEGWRQSVQTKQSTQTIRNSRKYKDIIQSEKYTSYNPITQYQFDKRQLEEEEGFQSLCKAFGISAKF